jgi:signal transduction histidine kinase/ActR/RegA family two-component response regulator
LLCFDACRTEIHWEDNSIRSLQNFASTLCTVIMPRRGEQETIRIRDQWITTFNSIEDAIFLLDDGSMVINANRAALKTVKADNLASILGRPLTQIIHGEEGRFDKTCLAERAMAQDTQLIEEVHSAFLDKIFMSSAFPMYQEEGKLSGVIYIARDITRERAFELQLAQAQKMEAIGVLAGGIAHDFNNILAAIMGFAELALFKLEAGKTQGLDTDLKQISQAGIRAKDLVTQLLAFSRNQTSPKTLLTVTPILKETVKMLKAFIPANIRITTTLGPETGNVLADGTALHQVFMNLGSNAAHAMKKKRGELHITLAETTPTPEQRDRYQLTQDKYLKITFSDQGTGVDPLIVDKIFDPFFTTKKVDEGTGMGLATVHGIMEEHKGWVELENHPGQGATFQLWLPVSNEKTNEQPPATAKQTDQKTPDCGTVLVVDDEEMLLMMFREMFAILHCKTLTCNTPTQALDFLKKNQDIDLLCTDLNMPEMSGIQLAERCHQIRPNLPVILCSGLTASIEEDDIKRAGIDKVIAKPINMKSLKDTLQELKEKRGQVKLA